MPAGNCSQNKRKTNKCLQNHLYYYKNSVLFIIFLSQTYLHSPLCIVQKAIISQLHALIISNSPEHVPELPLLHRCKQFLVIIYLLSYQHCDICVLISFISHVYARSEGAVGVGEGDTMH